MPLLQAKNVSSFSLGVKRSSYNTRGEKVQLRGNDRKNCILPTAIAPTAMVPTAIVPTAIVPTYIFPGLMTVVGLPPAVVAVITLKHLLARRGMYHIGSSI